MEILALVIAVLALFVALLAVAFHLVDRDVSRTLNRADSEEIPHRKRELARCLLVLVSCGAVFALGALPALPRLASAAAAGQTATLPLWMPLWLILGFIVVVLSVQALWSCLRMAMLLRDPATLSFTATWLILWATIRGKDHVVIRSRPPGRTGPAA